MYNDTMQTAYEGSLVTILILHEISILIICTPPLLELSGQLLPLLRGDVVLSGINHSEIFSFGFQVGEHLLVLPHVNLTQGRWEVFRFLNVVMFVIKKGLSGVGAEVRFFHAVTASDSVKFLPAV